MDAVMASETGFLGNNVDSNVSLPYAYTELVRKAEEGDVTAQYKIEQLKRHYQGENAEELIAYLNNAIESKSSEGTYGIVGMAIVGTALAG